MLSCLDLALAPSNEYGVYGSNSILVSFLDTVQNVAYYDHAT